MTALQAWLLGLTLGAVPPPGGRSDDLPKSPALSDPVTAGSQEPPRGELPLRPQADPRSRGRSFIDFEWLELCPRMGVVSFSEDYHSDPSFSGSLLARAPMPWLSPASDPRGEYFGAFAELSLAQVDRDIDPEPEDPDGLSFFFTVGIDFTLLRGERWLFMVHGGLQYASYGGVTDLDSGFGGLFGATAGVKVSDGITVTYTPEIAFANAGDWLFFNFFGVMIEF